MNYSNQQLTYLVAIDRYRSFSKAAEHCFVRETLGLEMQEKEKANADDDSDRSEESRKEDIVVDGEDWAKEYAAHCAEKEKEFFEANKPKEL